jgi:hypothetical protein
LNAIAERAAEKMKKLQGNKQKVQGKGKGKKKKEEEDEDEDGALLHSSFDHASHIYVALSVMNSEQASAVSMII